MSSRPEKPHYLTLDGLRGWAALAVVIYHVCLPVGINLASKAYLAVDFFFLLSGLVVANAYEAKLRGGMTFQQFAGIRLRRLYPLFALGMAMGVVVSLLKIFLVVKHIDPILVSASIAMAFLLIPFGRLPYGNTTFAFPFNGPAWSLFFEFAINGIYACIVRWLSTRVLVAIIAVSAAALGATLMTRGALDVGGQLETFAGGLARVSFSFFLGVGLCRLNLAGRLPAFRNGAVISTIMLLAILLTPAFGRASIYDALAVFILFPVIIVVALSASAGRFAPMATVIGALSYPIYITHYPIMRVFQYVVERWKIEGAKLYALVGLELVLIFGFGAAALYLFDKPIQRIFKRFDPRRDSVAKPVI